MRSSWSRAGARPTWRSEPVHPSLRHCRPQSGRRRSSRRPARCAGVAGAAVTQTFDEIGAAIPLGCLLFIVLDHAGLEVEPVPGRNAAAHVVGKFSAVLGGWFSTAGSLIRKAYKAFMSSSVTRLKAVGECRVEVLAFAVHAVAHGALEGFKAPAADTGLGVRRDVAGVDGAEGLGMARPPALVLPLGAVWQTAQSPMAASSLPWQSAGARTRPWECWPAVQFHLDA